MPARPVTLFGLPLVLLALAVQIAFGAVVLQPQIVELARLSQTGSICRAGAPTDEHGPATPHRAPHCMFCPLCAAVAGAGHVLAGAEPPLAPPPQVVTLAQEGMPPPATAPPVAPHFAAQPRGPPTLLT